jgi:hypothetical protein
LQQASRLNQKYTEEVMAKRIIIGGILGGIVMFFWGFVSHVLTPIGSAGFKGLPNEDAVINSLSQNIRQPGLYIFPGFELMKGSKEQQHQAEELWKRGPNGMMVYNPTGSETMSARQIGIEALSDIVCALIAAFILAKAVGNLGGVLSKALFVALIGVVASVAIDLSYWNWYGFPGVYFAAQFVDQAVGFFLTGIVLALFIKKPAA